MFKWFSGREAAEVGTALADDFIVQTASAPGARQRQKRTQGQEPQQFLQKFLQRVDQETRPLKLNILRRATLANSFKWRLLEKGVEQNVVEELTRAVVLQLTTGRAEPAPADEPVVMSKRKTRAAVHALLVQGDEHATNGALEQAIDCYQQALSADPDNVVVRDTLGVILCRLGRFEEGGEQFRQVIKIKDSFAEAHFHLGSLLRAQGYIAASEQPLRRSLKLKPTLLEARISLGATLYMLGDMKGSRSCFEKALRVAPRHVEALTGMGQLCAMEGHFAEAETWFNRALEVNPKHWLGWVGLAGLRKMSAADEAWIKGAQASADSGIPAQNEASVRKAMGKYYDQVGDYAQAFKSFRRANELIKAASLPYDKEAQANFCDNLIRAYTREALAGPHPGASDSSLPVLVVGMPRSGSSLVEQILASHPMVSGAGELSFWPDTLSQHLVGVLHGPPDEATRRRLAAEYLRELRAYDDKNAARIVDKALFNIDSLGVIHSVFPNARIIHVQRDPIDTCLSCYFQDFPPALNFTFDLADLAHYYRLRARMMKHWRSVLPPGTLLDVPYEELIADQEGWTRRMLEFLELPWDERCLSFHSTERSVLTASYWQVRQKVYNSSVGRWRHYKKFVGPLLDLSNLPS
jgi:tetratricopeptide (TPR) repeat protein